MNKKFLVFLINFAIGIVIGSDAIYFFTSEKNLFEGSNPAVLLVCITSVVALVLCRFLVLKSISKGKK